MKKRYQRVCVYGVVFLLGVFALPMAEGVAQKTATNGPIASASGSHETLPQELMVELETQQKFPALLFDELAQLTAGGKIELALLQTSGDQMILKGTAQSNPVVTDLWKNMVSSSLFQNVELKYNVIRQTGEQRRDFRLDATLNASFAAPVEVTSQELLQKFLNEKEDIPLLLDQIHASLREVGLKIYLFQPQAVIQKDGYAEVPLFVEAVGGYQHGMAFTKMIGHMDRFVTLRDIEVYFDEPEADNMSATVVTYTISDM